MLALPKQLAQGQLGSSSATLYTAPTGTDQKCIVKEIWLCNTSSTTDYTFTLYSVVSGGSAGVTNEIANAVNLPAGYTYVLQIAHVIEASGTLRGFASTASKITYTASGVEIL